MRINKKIIDKLNPCKERFDNYLKYYSDFNGDLKDFILLENITYKDKVWVITKLFTKEQNVKWSLLCASKVLSIFEEKYPEDRKPRKALEAVEIWLQNPNEENRKNAAYAADAAYAAAYAAYAANAAYAAANAAAYAAYAANAAAYAAYAAANAAAAAYAAANAAYAADAQRLEEEVNLLLMIEAENV